MVGGRGSGGRGAARLHQVAEAETVASISYPPPFWEEDVLLAY